jgi:hypothetical protein
VGAYSVRFRQLIVAAALALAPVLAQAAPQAKMLDLGDGYQFELIGAGNTEARVANPKSIYVNVALKNDKLAADHAKMIEAADRLFESVLMGAAEKGYFTRATVAIRKPGSAAAPAYEAFLYQRGENEVWLRQAGDQPWKVAQDPKWTAPETEKLEVEGFGTFAVEMAVEIPAPEGFARAAEIDFVTKTPVLDMQRKYQEIKALWTRIDRAQMRTDGFDMILIGNFAEAPRGRFHARKGFFVRIPREKDGDWPTLPDHAPDDRDLLISKNEVGAEELAAAIRETFATGPAAMRLTQVAAPAIDTGAAAAALAAAANAARVGFAQGAPLIRLAPKAAIIIR